MPEDMKLIYQPDGRVCMESNNDPAVDQVTGYQRYWLGADLGQAHDYSAIGVIRDTRLPVQGRGLMLGPRERVIVYADKFRGVSYVDVVDYLIRLRNTPPFAGRCDLCIDGSSLGRVVSDMLHEQSVPHSAIQMTGGQEWSRKGRYINASKTLLVENTSVLFASGELAFAMSLPLRKEIEDDLASFTLTTTAAGNQIISQSRTASGHGDIGIALIVAAFASQYLNQTGIVQSTLRGWY